MDAAAHPYLSAGYLVSGFVMAGIYLPQLVRGWRNPHATVIAQSLTSWSVWAGCRVVALLYGCLVIGDPLFVLAVSLDLLGRFAVLAVLLRAMWLQAGPRQRRVFARLEGTS